MQERISRPRRGLTAAAAALVVATLSLGTAMSVSWLRGKQASPHAANGDPIVQQMPSSPLEPRSEAAVAWSGEAMFVWGGSPSDWGHPGLLGDGAAYDPAKRSWELLPEAPLSPRYGSSGIWTGTEFVVWGGLDADRQLASDGAAYNPATRTWRALAGAPEQRAYARPVLVGNEVAFVGGDGPDGSPSTLLFYAADADAWRTLPGPLYVREAISGGGEVFTLAVNLHGATIAAINPLTGERHGLPDLNLSYPPAGVGLAWDGQLLVGITEESTTRVLAHEDGHWREVAHTAADPGRFSLPEMHSPALGYEPYPMVITDGRLLFSDYGVYLWDMTSGSVKPLAKHACSGAAVVWTGRTLLSWSGEDCLPRGENESAIGIEVTPGIAR